MCTAAYDIFLDLQRDTALAAAIAVVLALARFVVVSAAAVSVAGVATACSSICS